MSRFDQRSVTELARPGKGRAVGRTSGRTAQTRMVTGFVLPSYLVLPDSSCTPAYTRATRNARRMNIKIGREGREVGRMQAQQGFDPSYLLSYLDIGRTDERIGGVK